MDEAIINRAWIITYTGKKFYLLNPQPEMIDIKDIAHALSMMCRWTGHTCWHYSVSQHSWYVSHLVPKEFALSALLHDASEAYLGDMNRPLKHFTSAGSEYRKVEESVERAIFKKYNLPYPMAEEVKGVDNQMLYAEKSQLMKVTRATKYESMKWGCKETEAPITIEKWTPHRAETMFLKRFQELGGAE